MKLNRPWCITIALSRCVSVPKNIIAPKTFGMPKSGAGIVIHLLHAKQVQHFRRTPEHSLLALLANSKRGKKDWHQPILPPRGTPYCGCPVN